jgi:hypothetical protein
MMRIAIQGKIRKANSAVEQRQQKYIKKEDPVHYNPIQ